MRILVTNDDGIYSPGIASLARVGARYGEVAVVAPDVEHSSAGQGISSSRPLRYRPARLGDGIEAYRVDGTPADCVALGISEWAPIDVVLSGINLGANLGHAIWNSGTVAAAKQALLFGVPGIAVSTPSVNDEADFIALEPHLAEVLDVLLSQLMLPLVNVNIPPNPRGLRWTRQAVDQYDWEVVPAEDPKGRRIHWFRTRRLEPSEPGTDRWAIANGYVSVTPLRLDITDHAELARLESWREPR
jgi:5'-nucleotidase